jgi:hypothetical protein
VSGAAAELLQRLQKERFAASGQPLPSEQYARGFDEKLAREIAMAQGITDVDAVVEESRRSFDQRLAATPSPYEDPGTVSLMDLLMADLERAAELMELELPPRPVFGSLPLGQLNAMAIAVPESDERLVVFQSGLLGYFNLLSKAVAAALPASEAGEDDKDRAGFDLNRDRVRANLMQDPEPLARLTDFLAAYVVHGDPHSAEQYVLAGRTVPVANLLRHSSELFVLAHELGHLLAGHLDHPVRDLAPVVIDDEDGTTMPGAWPLEFEADYIGMALTTCAMHDSGYDFAMSYVGVDFTFSSMLLVERAISLLIHGEERDSPIGDSHPPPLLRREILRGQLPDFTKDEEAAESAVQLATSIDKILELMWSMVRPWFLELREEGVTANAIWTMEQPR